ncbi:hypothetical protein GCM10011380_00120 [Sphingomonas metalli]|uniref:Uncharacterized protein n=1 Tax=Sphingomonas metalli TaxID=1779358 RepID=A0A916SRX3_9SPHN|nr:hypothetical protein [Sphingomonas metalli]GGB14703.1 hypothetical protein GCM10011380_00120 [Sphingomonas metalli]
MDMDLVDPHDMLDPLALLGRDTLAVRRQTVGRQAGDHVVQDHMGLPDGREDYQPLAGNFLYINVLIGVDQRFVLKHVIHHLAMQSLQIRHRTLASSRGYLLSVQHGGGRLLSKRVRSDRPPGGSVHARVGRPRRDQLS